MAQIKDLKRMCAAHESCKECPLRCDCSSPNDFSDNADEIVDKWVKEHPVKTYAMDFFEKFPNAPKDDNGTPIFCMRYIYADKKLRECLENNVNCSQCWNKEMEE